MLLDVGLTVQAARKTFSTSDNYTHPLIKRMRDFVYNAKTPTDEIELVGIQITQAADWMNSIPYRDERQTYLWRFLMLATKLGALEND